MVETLDGCRWLYNHFLSKDLSKEDLQFALTELKEHKPWLRNYHSKMLQMVIHKIDSARKALIALRKKGYKTGKSYYLTHEKYNSFTYNQSGFRIQRHGKTDLLWLSKIGYITIRLHRSVNNIKQITVCRRVDKWYAFVCCELSKPIFKFLNPNKSIGIDVGITKFIHDSDNLAIENPLFLNKIMKPLKRSSRKMARRKKGSQNHEKAKRRLQILHERVRNKRNDFLHKISNYYSKQYDVVFLERLHTLNMVKNSYLARYILDSGWRKFKQLLEYKAKMVVEVEPKNTTINCHRCGNKVPKTLAIRIHKCDVCGLAIDRDYNASMNILQRGLLLLPVERREFTPVEIECRSKKQENIGFPIDSRVLFKALQ